MTLTNSEILIIINLFFTLFISPLTTSVSKLISHIKKSSCCGSNITVRESDIKIPTLKDMEIRKLSNQLERLKNLKEIVEI